jgi:hypothetical protein
MRGIIGMGVDGRRAPHRRISKPWTLAAALVAALVVGATGLASSLAPPTEARALGELFFGKNLARAEIVMVTRGVVHDYRMDQGKIMSVHAGSIELLERDGTKQTVPLAADVQVWANGKLASLAVLTPKLNAITIRDGDLPAQVVRVTGNIRKQ